jgi:hypothetical protein
MRNHEGKTNVRVYDDAGVRVPILRAMPTRRLAPYKTSGFSCEPAAAATPSPQITSRRRLEP